MIQYTLLIQLAEIDNYVSIPDIVKERAQISQALFETQFQYVRPIIGQDKYSELITEIEAGTLTTDNSKLIYGDGLSFLGIAPYLIYQTLAGLYVRYGLETTRGGLKKLTDDNSENISDNERQRLINYAQEQAYNYKKDLERYLKINELSQQNTRDENFLQSIQAAKKDGYYRRRRF